MESREYPTRVRRAAAALLAALWVALMLAPAGRAQAQGEGPVPIPDGGAAQAANSARAVARPAQAQIPGQFIVHLGQGASRAQGEQFAREAGAQVVRYIEALGVIVIRVPDARPAEALPPSAAVAFVEPDYQVSAAVAPLDSTDDLYALQWGHPATNIPAAWAALPPGAPTVTVAVLDSGVCADHPDLVGRVLTGWDFVDGDDVPQDVYNHGCSVTGIIAANTDNTEGIAGVAPNAQILPVRVLDQNGFGAYSTVAEGMVYAVDNGAQILNMSLSGPFPSPTLENAVNYAKANGVKIVAAAGNYGQEGAQYPAAYPDVIAVGAVDENLRPSDFSNYGSDIDVWAPGRQIASTAPIGVYTYPYQWNTGTSFAAPYVAGYMAVLMGMGSSLPIDGQTIYYGTPAAPLLNSPLGQTTDTTPRYRWDEIPGATGYELWIIYTGDDRKVFRKTYKPAICNSNGVCAVTPQRAQGHGQYEWTVKAILPGSEQQSIVGLYTIETDTPEIIGPVGTIRDTTPRYRWTVVEGGTSYELIVTRTSNGAEVFRKEYAIAICDAGRCQVTPGKTLNRTGYTWRVRAYTTSGSTWSPWVQYTIN